MTITVETAKGIEMTVFRRGQIRIEHHSGDEFSGINRVLKVLSGVKSKTLCKIDSARDCKGELFVSWLSKPTAEDMVCVESAWSAEGECMLRYQYPDGGEFEVVTHTTIRRQV